MHAQLSTGGLQCHHPLWDGVCWRCGCSAVDAVYTPDAIKGRQCGVSAVDHSISESIMYIISYFILKGNVRRPQIVYVPM